MDTDNEDEDNVIQQTGENEGGQENRGGESSDEGVDKNDADKE